MLLVTYELLKKSFWICAEHASKLSDIRSIRTIQEKPIFLELFSGSGDVSKTAALRGYETVTVDINQKFNPDICLDIHNLRRSQLPHFVHVLWISIPCTVYSILNLVNHWNKISLGYRKYLYVPKTKQAIKAVRILEKTLDLLKKINPLYYFIENPVGAMRHMPQLKLVPYRRTISYNDYGFDYLKPTDIFTNAWHFQPKTLTKKGRVLTSSIAQLSGNYERSLIPKLLIKEVLDSVDFLERRPV